MQQIVVQNPRNRHIGLKLLRTLVYLLLALTPLPPMLTFGVYVHYSRDLPELLPIESYYSNLKAPTTFHSANGMIIGEFFEERRLFAPLDEIPALQILALLAAEDERFLEHEGVDPRGILRAAYANLTAGKIVQGASTLTQQLAKSMLTNERSYQRKIREAILARRMEDVYSKTEILTLYMNQIFLGHNSYGFKAAAQNYFRKNLADLNLSEMTMLAVLPPSPSVVNPIRNMAKTRDRQAHVLQRMVKGGHITAAQAKAAQEQEVTVYRLLDEFGERMPYVVEESRKLVKEKYATFAAAKAEPDKEWLRHGLSIWTTVELDLQHRATGALVEELEKLDKKQGYRGPLGMLDSDEERTDFLEKATRYYASAGMLSDGALREGTLYLAVVEGVGKDRVRVKVTDEVQGTLRRDDMTWAGEYKEYPLVTYDVERRDGKTVVTKRKKDGTVLYQGKAMEAAPEDDQHRDFRNQELNREELGRRTKRWTIQKRDESVKVSWKPKLTDCTSVFEAGDVALVMASADGTLTLAQQPRVQGAVLSWDPWTGYVRAMAGGSDFDVSQVNRVHALRQTGSTMKPIYYGLAYDLGHFPSYAHSDAPYHRGGFKSTGGSADAGTMLTYDGLVKSRNTVSLRVSEYVTRKLEATGGSLASWGKALGLRHPLKGHRAEILGGDQTPWSMSGAFGLFLSGGLRAERRVVRKVADRHGRVIVDRTFFGDAHIGPRETLAAMYRDVHRRKERAIRESVAFLMRHNLSQVVRRGTATRAKKKLKRMAAGKTGSLPFDVWFNGFTREAVTTVWVGADTRERILGRTKTSSGVYGAGPPLGTFIKVAAMAAEGAEPASFLEAVPDSVVFVTVDPKTGNRTIEGGRELPHRSAFFPLYVHKGEGSTSDVHHTETEF